MRMRRWSPRWIAASASTIDSELISSTNDVTDVNGMLNSSFGLRTTDELRVASAVQEVRGDEGAEEQRLRRQEQPHRELRVADAGVRRVPVTVIGGPSRRARVSGDDCLRHQWAPTPRHAFMRRRLRARSAGSMTQAFSTEERNEHAEPRASHQFLNTKP